MPLWKHPLTVHFCFLSVCKFYNKGQYICLVIIMPFMHVESVIGTVVVS